MDVSSSSSDESSESLSEVSSSSSSNTGGGGGGAGAADLSGLRRTYFRFLRGGASTSCLVKSKAIMGLFFGGRPRFFFTTTGAGVACLL